MSSFESHTTQVSDVTIESIYLENEGGMHDGLMMMSEGDYASDCNESDCANYM